MALAVIFTQIEATLLTVAASVLAIYLYRIWQAKRKSQTRNVQQHIEVEHHYEETNTRHYDTIKMPQSPACQPPSYSSDSTTDYPTYI